MTRRTFLAASSGAALAASRHAKIAAIITAYYRNSHADVFIGNMLRGFYWEGKPHESQLDIAAMYLAQTPANDIGRAEAAKHSIPIKPSVREAIVSGSQGVALIGEHGDYPTNQKGQKLYPRYELMEQIVKVYRETGRALPTFVDKHFSTDWKQAKQMFDWSRELHFPLIAGTSLTLTWRRPVLELDLGAPVKAVGYFYGGKESYGYHGVEVFQSMVERRAGGWLLLRGERVVRLPRGRGLPEHGGTEKWRRDRSPVGAMHRGSGRVEVERRKSVGAQFSGGGHAL